MLVVVGDIHGCHVELMDLLDKVGPGSGDLIVSVGDMVDRGPFPLEVVRFFRDTPGATAVMGNHEEKHIRIADGTARPAPSQSICMDQAGRDYPEIAEYARTLPLYLDLAEATIVHAAIEPALPLDKQDRNILLHGRWPDRRNRQEWINRYDGDKPVVYGHVTHVPKPKIVGRTFGIDTGACHGFSLTALLLPSEEIVSVPAYENHWRAARDGTSGESNRPPEPELIQEAVDLVHTLLAGLPQPDDQEGRTALAAALAVHPAGRDLFPLAFAADRTAALTRRFGTSRQLTDALDCWREVISE